METKRLLDRAELLELGKLIEQNESPMTWPTWDGADPDERTANDQPQKPVVPWQPTSGNDHIDRHAAGLQLVRIERRPGENTLHPRRIKEMGVGLRRRDDSRPLRFR